MCEGLIKGSVHSRWGGLHMKLTFPGESFTLSNHRLALGGTVSPSSGRLQMQKIKEIKL